MRTPFLGQAYVAQSSNLADNALINLYPEMAPGQDGQAKDVAAFFMTPGLTLKVTCGTGPVRGMKVLWGVPPALPMLYVVSGSQVFSVTTSLVVTLIGTIGTSIGPVSMITNGTQMVIFDGINGYLAPGGFPLSGGAFSGGSAYAVNDLIYLIGQGAGSTQTATPVIQVTGVSGGVVTSYKIIQTGAFPRPPSSLVQSTTTGSGSGFTITTPTFGVLNTLYTLSLPFTSPLWATYQDGFGLVAKTNTTLFYQSNPGDLSIWLELNFASADSTPDPITGMASLHEEVYVFKSEHCEVWVNAGLTNFSFQRLVGVHIEQGCAATASLAKAGDSLCFVSASDTGAAHIRMIEGYEPVRISTPAIEYAMSTYSTVSDAIGFAYQMRGHIFYEVTFVSANVTWSYDLTTKQWHQEAAFSSGQFNRHWSNCYAYFVGSPLVGDYLTGNVYLVDPTNATDNGSQRKWLRSWRALPKPVFVPTTFASLQIDMMTGIGVAANDNPQVMLRWSDDGGHNWSNELFASAGKTGKTAQRVKFNRLGSTRYNSGLDRIFELSSTDQFGVCLIGADLQ